MVARSELLQRFLDCVMAAGLARAAPESDEAKALARISAALAGNVGTLTEAAPQRLPVCAALNRGLAIARTAGPRIAALGEALSALEPQLHWARRRTAREGDEPFYSGHANAYVIGGQAGLEQRADIEIGISLMAPDVLYPDHDHPPEEVYVSMAGGQWRNARTSWTEPGAGGLFYNPPGIRHAMRTNREPLLAVWCLWVG